MTMLTTTLLQIFFENVLYSKVIFKGMEVADILSRGVLMG